MQLTVTLGLAVSKSDSLIKTSSVYIIIVEWPRYVRRPQCTLLI